MVRPAGKMSFAATLAARTGTRLRPVAEAARKAADPLVMNGWRDCAWRSALPRRKTCCSCSTRRRIRLVGYARRKFMTPLPVAESFDAFNARLVDAFTKRRQAILRGHRTTIAERMQAGGIHEVAAGAL